MFYRQRRWGQGGRLFEVFKFRTMISDSDEKHGVVEARDEDERVTRIGAILRSFGIDELPQVLNIVKGEMSFVGPRPLAVERSCMTTTAIRRCGIACRNSGVA